ncbi:GNAT family N-acetyltransferase [Enterococcus sp. LJL99]
MTKITIRKEVEADYRIVEEVTREAFWDIYVPGASEHYLVHKMRSHKDFIPELAFVLEVDGKIIGNIMYTKATLIDENEKKREILTFGPVSILPQYQRQGYGAKLLEHSFEQARKLGYDVIVIFGSPSNYVKHGFKSCQKFNICLENGQFPTAMMVKELQVGTLDKKRWNYFESPVMSIDEKQAETFDQTFPKLEKSYSCSQEEFYIYSHSCISL